MNIRFGNSSTRRRKLAAAFGAMVLMTSACADPNADEPSSEPTSAAVEPTAAAPATVAQPDTTEAQPATPETDPAAPVTEVADTTPATPSTEEPGEPGGTLVAGYVGAVDKLTPNPFGAASFPFRDSLFDPFIAIDEAGTPIPMLAESWEASDDGLTMTLKLRSGATFHDGTPWNAEAAVANINWFKDPATGLQGGNSWAKVTPTIIDETTIELAMATPIPELYALFSIARVAKPGAFDSGIGTGPFVLADFTPRTGLTLNKNDAYWGDKALLDALELREFADATAAALAAQAGDIDVLMGADVTQLDGLESAGLTVRELPSPGNMDLAVNATAAGITDARIRQALSLAFDRERFVETILLGHGTPESSIYAPASPVRADDPGTVTPFDLDAAKALLDEAGASGLTIDIMSPPILPLDQFLPIYQADLASIGVTLNIQSADVGAWAGAMSQPGTIPEMATHQYQFADSDPSLVFITQVLRPTGNASGYDNPEYTAMIAEAAVMTDPAERLAAYRALDAFVTEEAFVIPVANATGAIALDPAVRNMTTLRGAFDFTNVTIAK